MRNLLFLPLVLMTLNIFGQQAAPTSPPQNRQWDGPIFIVTVQIGTDTLKNGIDTVKLSDETVMEMKQSMASPDYVVTLTPKGDCGQLNLAETNANNFIVKAQNGSTASQGIFQYTVIVKQRRPMMPMRPFRPHPQPPAGQQ